MHPLAHPLIILTLLDRILHGSVVMYKPHDLNVPGMTSGGSTEIFVGVSIDKTLQNPSPWRDKYRIGW